MENVNPAPAIKTLGELRTSGYQPITVKEEMRRNLIRQMKAGQSVFTGIYGFEDTVIPDLERAILSRHHILLLGLRGQAKTRIARLLIGLLDEWIPRIEATELPEDPMAPLTSKGKRLVEALGDELPLTWIHRSERYVEKLATPDVSVADLIGDIDPIKAANNKLSYSDEEVIHFGLIPRAHRGLFVINELPDLQARIQVALFNILQEGDIQIRGFVKRLHLDLQFIFTANPEDYTNRGSIITPLKDRIDSQILTHYPESTEISQQITLQEAKIADAQQESVFVPPLILEILDQITFVARDSELVDPKSGVSARLNISAYENLVSAVERRILKNGEPKGVARIQDFWAVVPSITGKIELVYEGEQEGPYQVAMQLMDEAIKNVFLKYFPHPEKLSKSTTRNPYGTILAWFAGGNNLSLLGADTGADFTAKLHQVAGLKALVDGVIKDPNASYAYQELAIHGLSTLQQIGKDIIGANIYFKDDLAGALDDLTNLDN